MSSIGIEQLRGIHAGRLCFIAGAGPSLRHLSPEQAAPHILIAVNSSINKFPNAQYMFSCDPGITIHNSWQLAKSLTCKIIIAQPEGTIEGFGAYDDKRGDSFCNGIAGRIVNVGRKVDEYSHAFNRSDKTLIFGQSSAHCACHMAFLMGCSPIVLVGCDCGVEDGKRFYFDYNDQKQWRDQLVDPKLSRYFSRETDILAGFVNGWDRIGHDNPNVKILNCGNAILPAVQPAKLKDVLEGRYPD